MSTARLNAYTASPKAMKAMIALNDFVENCGLEHSLLELVKMRASQINGCAYCLHMHSTDARKQGESEMRLYLLDAWRESSLYSERERAALAWTEALTRLSETRAPDADYAEIARHFSEEEQVNLTVAINMINSWNRIAVGFRSQHPKH
ncbi:carboxymuconolactone decarboxylase family protein [Achromobacter insolitus]|uniref:carboxymuconolactone decarboxylase family protein n=1 Tax=Achromobacter insolitus TaxID=217204 RepID=UPI001EED6DFC|nr:carboxymuconolactone decarboxylase family protein [Achromobacter insolitus]MDH3063803.1 carboxymuconolactone decarboxylase family protein [Achromobacter insolitus]WKK19725.1 carboxymuconolactone decarboxylase family protein [Achromobacter insolitus]